MAPVIDQGGHTHRVAPAREDPARGWATRYTRTACLAPLDTTRPPLPANTVVTCPRCQRANTKEN